MIVRDGFKKAIFLMLIIHTAADVLHAVANNQVVYLQQEIVGRYLVERLLLKFYLGGLVFNYHLRLRHLII